MRLRPDSPSTERARAQVQGKSVFCRATYHLSLLSPSGALCRPALQMLPKMWKVLLFHLSLAVVSSSLLSSRFSKDGHVAFLRSRHILVRVSATRTFQLSTIFVPGCFPAGVLFPDELSSGSSHADNPAWISNPQRCLAAVISTINPALLPSLMTYFPPDRRPAAPLLLPVDVSDCLRKSATLTLTDPNFTISGAGRVEAAATVAVSTAGRTFSVIGRDRSGVSSQMAVQLIYTPQRDGKKVGYFSALR